MATEGKYPVKPVYCGNCGLPADFCEYGVNFEACKPWLIKNVPHLYPQLVSGSAPQSSSSAAASSSTAASSNAAAGAGPSSDGVDAAATGVASMAVAGDGDDDEESGEEGEKKKKTKRGGQVIAGGAKPKPAAAASKQQVIITVETKGRRNITKISGLDSFGVKLKEAASALGKKFGAGATVGKSVTGIQEIDVQGDVAYDLPDILAQLYEIPEKAIKIRE